MKKIRHRKEDGFPVIIILLLPAGGILLWLAKRLVILFHKENSRQPDIDKLKVTDARYRRLAIDTGSNNDNMMPLEDALAIDDTHLRRSLMLDILHKNPEEYLKMLEKASAGDDVEITHYATTTLLEIQSQYEGRIRQYMYEMEQSPGNIMLKREYKECLSAYINSGLIDGTVLKVQQESLLELMAELTECHKPDREDAYLYITTALDLKRYEEAEKMLLRMYRYCDDDELWYRLAVRYYWEQGNRDEIHRIVDEVIKKEIYLTKEGKKWLAFWSKGQINEGVWN